MSFKLNQFGLFNAINEEISRQVPGMPADPRLMNAVIAAANSLVDEFAKPIVKASPGMGLGAWLSSDDTGSSSLFMAYTLSTALSGGWPGFVQPQHNYPRDPDDLGRCIRLTRAVPQFAGLIFEMREHGKEWKAVAENWDRWVELYDGEDGHTLYDEMEEAFK